MCCLRLFLFLQATEEQFSASYPNVRTVAIKKVTIRYFFFIFLLLLVLLLSPRSPPSRLQISVNANLLPHSHKNFLIAVDIILTQYARWHHIAPHHTHTHTHNTPRYRFKVHTIHNSRRCEANAVQKRAFAFKRTVLSVIGWFMGVDSYCSEILLWSSFFCERRLIGFG